MNLFYAHKYCTANKKSLEKEEKCGCFYCMEIFSPTEIEEWIEDKEGDTAICPYCNIDSVIGESVSYPLTKEFLEKMNKFWF